MTSVSVRPAGPDDAEAIVRINVSGWQTAYRGLIPDDVLDRMDAQERIPRWRAWFVSPPPEDRTWVAVRDGVIVGYIASHPSPDEDLGAPGEEIQACYVAPGDWRSGVGGALMTRVVQEARAPLVLWVLVGNERAIDFYSAFGFRPDGARSEHVVDGAPLPVLRLRRSADSRDVVPVVADAPPVL